jgi:hypothetical protein
VAGNLSPLLTSICSAVGTLAIPISIVFSVISPSKPSFRVSRAV